MDSTGNIKFHSLAMNCCFVSHVTIGSDTFMCFQQERLGASCFAQGTLQEMFVSEFIDEHHSCRMIGKTITVFCGGYTPRLLRQIRRCRSVQYAKYVRLHLPEHLAQPFRFDYNDLVLQEYDVPDNRATKTHHVVCGSDHRISSINHCNGVPAFPIQAPLSYR